MPTRAVIVDATKHQYRFVANLAVADSLSDERTASQNRHGHRALRALQAPAICSRCRSCRDMRRLSSSRRQGARVALLLQLLHHLSVAQKRNKQSRATIKQSSNQASKQASNQAGKQSCNQAIKSGDQARRRFVFGLFECSAGLGGARTWNQPQPQPQ